MIRLIQLIISPFKTWEKIAQSGRGIFFIFLLMIVPLLVGGLALESYSLVRWGLKNQEFGHIMTVSKDLATRYVIVQFVLLSVSVFFTSAILQMVATNFQVRTTFKQCFTLMAYAFGTLILSRFLDAIPNLPTWVAWAIGVFLAICMLYHGVGTVLRPDQTKGFGIYLISIILIVCAGAISHVLAVAVLQGRLLASPH